MSSSAGVAGALGPFLDIGTQLKQNPGQRVSFASSFSSPGFVDFPVISVVYPACGEGVVVWRGRGDRFETGELREWDNAGRSRSRRRGSIRRMCASNGLGYLLSLTFKDEPLSVDAVWREVKLFRKRLRYELGFNFPYVFVVERGEKFGRLHVHVCIGRWYVDLGVHVRCAKCVLDNWKWDSSGPPVDGCLCLGCLWGKGIVHGPSEKYSGEVRANGDARRAAMYVSKYVSKELLGELGAGRQLYRVAQDFQPVVERAVGVNVEDMRGRVGARLGGSFLGVENSLMVTALHEEIVGWEGPPTWTLRIDLPSLPIGS